MNEALADTFDPLEYSSPAEAPDSTPGPIQDIQPSADPYNKPIVTNALQSQAGSGLLNRPGDLLREIFDRTELFQAGDLLNLTRSCRALYFLIPTNKLYRHIHFLIRNGRFLGTAQVQQFISVLDQHPERSLWVQEADFTRTFSYEHSWNLELQELLQRLPTLRTLQLRTLGPMPDNASLHSHVMERAASRMETTISVLQKMIKLQSLTFEDTCLTLSSVSQLSRLQNLKHLRVRWAYEEAAEAELSAGELNNEPPSTVTRLELLTPLVPNDVSVNYVLRHYPSLKELSWIMCDRKSNELSRVSVFQPLVLMSHLLVELHFSHIDARTVMSQKLLDFSSFSVLRILKIHNNMILPFNQPNDQRKAGFDLAKRLPSSLKILEVAYNHQANAATPAGWIMAKDASGSLSCCWLASLVLYKRLYFPQLSEVALRRRTDTQYQDLTFRGLNKESGELEWVLTKSKLQLPEIPNHLKAVFKRVGISLKHKTSVKCFDSAYYPLEDEDNWYKRE